MLRTPLTTPATRSISLIALAPLAVLAACGGSDTKPAPETDTVAATSPVVVQPESTTSTPDAGSVVPTNVSYEQAASAYRARKYGDAAQMFDAYTKNRAQNPWGFYMLGLSSWKAGQLDQAQSAFEKALALDPRHVKSLVNLSRVLIEQHRPDEALERIDQAIALDSNAAESWRVLGRVQGERRHTDDAIGAYRTALAIDPEDPWSLNNMGLVLIRAGRYADALAPLARATQLDDSTPVFQNNLGVALERTGHFGAAAEAYRAALEVDSGYVKAKASLARVDGRADDPSAMPVDVTALGDDFADQVEQWHGERVDTSRTASDTSTMTVGQKPVVKADSLKPPR